MEINASEWKAVGIEIPTGNMAYPSTRMLIPYSESARDLLRKALALVEAGLEAKSE